MNAKTNIIRKSLRESLASVVTQDKVDSAIERFDKLSKFGPEMAAQVTLNSLGLQESHAGVSEYIASQLKKYSDAHPKIETNSSILKLRELVKRLNKKIADCGATVTVNGKELSTFELEKAKVKLAPCLQDQMWTYTTTGSVTVDGKTTCKEFGIETIG